MKVLSLFDGISCGMVALERVGITVEKYIAYEIEPNAIKISKKNYKQIEHMGDVTKADFSAQSRPRFYWTNIPFIKKYEKSKAVLKDILERNVDEKYFYSYPLKNIDMTKQVCAIMDFNNHEIHKRIFNPAFKCHTLTACNGGHQKKVMDNGRARKLTPLEYERLQTLPNNYTAGVSDTARYNALGNAWTVDVIAHILRGIKDKGTYTEGASS